MECFDSVLNSEKVRRMAIRILFKIQSSTRDILQILGMVNGFDDLK